MAQLPDDVRGTIEAALRTAHNVCMVSISPALNTDSENDRLYGELIKLEAAARWLTQQAAQPPSVQPVDWSSAPDWAEWWTRDVSGVTMWWETKPLYDGRMGIWMNEDDSLRSRGTDLPIIARQPATAQESDLLDAYIGTGTIEDVLREAGDSAQESSDA